MVAWSLDFLCLVATVQFVSDCLRGRLLIMTVILLLHHTIREGLMSTLPSIQFERQ